MPPRLIQLPPDADRTLLKNVGVFVVDAMSETTRSERRGLLWVATITIAVTIGRVSPASKFVFGGVEFVAESQRLLYMLLGLVNVYFVAAFITYAATDYLAWYYKFDKARLDPVALRHTEVTENVITEWADRSIERALTHWTWAKLLFAWRLLIDVLAPIAMGLVAAYFCFFTSPAIAPLIGYPIWVAPDVRPLLK